MEDHYIPRIALHQLESKVKAGKALLLLGARRTGKTALLRKYLASRDPETYLFLNGEDLQTAALLQDQSLEHYQRLLGKRKLLVLDEAQKVPEIGNHLKFIIDHFPQTAVIATGSSVFDLNNKLGEPLVGRSQTLYLFPLAQEEFRQVESYRETRGKLEERLILGSYPELTALNDWEDQADYLEELVNGYLLKDILSYQGIRKSDKLLDLLRLLAHQIGHTVSVDELANNIRNISRNTVENYLDLLSKVFVIYKIRGFSRNQRNEITKNPRWYFYDNGVRNALIRNFNPMSLRMDQGMLWENYLMGERLKFLQYFRRRVSRYFWRHYNQQEIDNIEVEADTLRAFEFKWNPKKTPKPPSQWTKNYPQASFEVITPANYLEFITHSP